MAWSRRGLVSCHVRGTMMRRPSLVCLLLALGAGGAGRAQAVSPPRQAAAAAPAAEAAQAIVSRTCASCHSDRTRSGNLSLDAFDVTSAGCHAEIAEKMIRMLRAGLMPPAGSRRPDE